jgi:hypothetical protein
VALSQRFDQQAYLISSLRSGCRLLLRDQVLAQRADIRSDGQPGPPALQSAQIFSLHR